MRVLTMTTLQIPVCIDIQYIDQVFPLPALESVPQGVKELVGMVNYHGTVLSVYDLGMLLGYMRQEAYQLNTSVVVCSDGKKSIGLIVDTVAQLEQVEKDKIKPRTFSDDQASDWVKSVAVIDDQLYLLIDMAVMNHAQ